MRRKLRWLPAVAALFAGAWAALVWFHPLVFHRLDRPITLFAPPGGTGITLEGKYNNELTLNAYARLTLPGGRWREPVFCWPVFDRRKVEDLEQRSHDGGKVYVLVPRNAPENVLVVYDADQGMIWPLYSRGDATVDESLRRLRESSGIEYRFAFPGDPAN